jgi:hypothetical protein
MVTATIPTSAVRSVFMGFAFLAGRPGLPAGLVGTTF